MSGQPYPKTPLLPPTAWIVLTLVGALAAATGLMVYLTRTAAPLHPDPQRAPSIGQAVRPQWADAVGRARQVMLSGLAAQNLPGLSVAVGIGGTIVWAEGFGWADIDAQKPVTPETRFMVGTASKALTSAAVGVLVEKGRLDLDSNIRTYVPEFPERRWAVTLRQLMGQVAGVRSDSGDEGPLFSQRCKRPVEALPHFADRDLLFEPGTAYRESKYSWILVSAAIEAASNRPFLAFIQDEIFQPAGMNGTGAESATEENPDHVGEPGEDAPFLTFFSNVFLEPLGMGGPAPAPTEKATFYFPRFGGDPRYGRHLMRPHNLSCYAGSMAFLSTPSDLVRFGHAIAGGALLQPATVQTLQTPQRLTSGQETGYGLGWEVETVALAGRLTRAIGHDGETLGGMTASLVTFPERGLVVSVMSNISYADTSALARQAAEAFARSN